MNERVKELFIQKFGKRNLPKGNAEVLMSADDLEKFAELIVRECANVGERYADGNYEVPNQILIHFGLEEPEE